MVVRQADPDEALDGIEAQYGGAGGICGIGTCGTRFRLRAKAIRPDPDGLCNDLYFGFRIPLSRGVGTAHEHDRSKMICAGGPAWSKRVAARLQPRQLAFALPHAE